MPDPLPPKEVQALKLLIKFTGPSLTIRYKELRKAKFPEQLEEIYKSDSEYLDSLANRKFQKLVNFGWIELDGTGKITVLHTP